MTIAKRLFILLAVPLAVFLGLAWFTRSQLTKVEERADFVARSRIAALTTIGNLSRSYTEMRVDVRDCILLTNDARRQEARQRFAEDEAEVKRLLNHYADHLVVSNQGRRLLADYRALSDEWIARAKEVVELADAGQRDAAAKYMVENTSPIGNKLTEVSREWIKNNEELATEAGDAALGAIESYRRDTTIAIVAAALLTALLGAVTADRIVRPIRALDSSVRGIAGGDYAKVVPFIEAPDETGGLARSIDVLKQGAAAMEDQRWVKSHVSSLTAEVQGAETVAEFGQHFLAKLVPLLGGGVAGFYLLDEKGERLRRTATYGLTASATPADTIRLGEGLAGQCAQDRQMTMLTDLPPDYLRVSSSLGGGTPRVAVALPLLTKDTLLGVLEIAAFRELNPREKTLLTEILPLAAMSLEVLQRNLRTEELLTQTKSQAKQMEETEKFFRSVLELAPDGLMVVGADGVIRLANAQCEKLFGYARSELVGQAVEMLVPDTVRGHHSGLRESFHRAPSVRAMGTGRELQARRKDGSLFPVEIGLSPLPARGTEGMQVAVSIRDVTEQKKQQAEIMAAKQKAVEATEMKSMFLANMSHEIRTPMNAIIGLSHLALKTPLNPKQRDYVSKVHNAGTSLLAIINDILDFSKIEAGKLELD
ncbi:MAG TPA: PAS domain S-box protein, partial [Candidatus Didemnitutus sp.]|nr:PAS domain S-box protein [Candidatus Didemnitutus sp.]